MAPNTRKPSFQTKKQSKLKRTKVSKDISTRKPSFQTKKQSKLKRTKVSKDIPMRKQIVTDDCTNSNVQDVSQVDKNISQMDKDICQNDKIAGRQMLNKSESQNGKTVHPQINKINGQNVKNGESAVNKKAKNDVRNVITTHKDLSVKLKLFASKEVVTRRELVTLGDIVAIYTELKDQEINLVRVFKTYLETIC